MGIIEEAMAGFRSSSYLERPSMLTILSPNNITESQIPFTLKAGDDLLDEAHNIPLHVKQSSVLAFQQHLRGVNPGQYKMVTYAEVKTIDPSVLNHKIDINDFIVWLYSFAPPNLKNVIPLQLANAFQLTPDEVNKRWGPHPQRTKEEKFLPRA